MDLPIEISKDDVIVTKNLDGSDKYIVPYNKTYQPVKLSGVSKIMDYIKNDDAISNISLSGNLLSYTIFDDINVTIEETNENGIMRLDITEDNKISTLEFDSTNGQVFLNGSPVKYSITEAYIFEKNTSTRAVGEWFYYDTMYPNLEAEDEIRMIPLNVFISLLGDYFGWFKNEYFSVSLKASEMINSLVEADNATKTLYCERDIYKPEVGYYAFKYYDDVYADSDYTEFLESAVWIQYE